MHPARSELDRVDDVGVDQQHRHARSARRTRRTSPAAAWRRRRSPGSGGRAAGPSRRCSALPQRARDVPAVQRQQRQQVEEEQHRLSAASSIRSERSCHAASASRRSSVGDLAAEPADADDADRAVRVALAGAERRPRGRRSSAGCAGRRRRSASTVCRRCRRPARRLLGTSSVAGAKPRKPAVGDARRRSTSVTGSPLVVDLPDAGHDRVSRSAWSLRRRRARRRVGGLPALGADRAADLRPSRVTGWPSTETIWSPGLQPGRVAGAAGSLGAQVVAAPLAGDARDALRDRADRGGRASRCRTP